MNNAIFSSLSTTLSRPAVRQKSYSSRYGVTTVEYILIGLVLLASLGGLSLLGGGLGKWISMLKGNMGASIAASNTAQAALITPPPNTNAPNGTTPPSPGTPPATPPTTGGSSTVCMNGTCVNVPSALAQSSFTIGANGSTNLAAMQQMLDVYKQVADMLQKDPTADPYLAQLLTELAQAGHSNANTQNTMLKFDSTYSSTQVATTVGDFSNSYQNFQTINAKVQPLLSKLPPDTAALITNSTTVVEGVMGSVDQATKTGGTPDMNKITESNVNLTRTESNNICKNGGSPPNCIQ